VRFWAALCNLFTNKSYNISRFFNDNFNEKLAQILQTQVFDIIHLESPFVGDYLPTLRRHTTAATKIILRTHNAEHIIWQRMAQKTQNPALKYYYNLCAKRLYNYEKTIINQVDAVVAITQNDKNIFIKMGCTQPIFVSSGGADTTPTHPEILPKNHPQNHALCFIASLDWLPNIEGLDWFLDKVWHKIIAQNPQATLHIAGRNMPTHIKKTTQPNIKIHGETPNAQAYMQQNGILIVPLLSGSGMRIKIIEAMALRKAIVTTSVGAEGIDITHQTHCLIADTPQAFADACLLLLQNPTLCQTIGNNAHTRLQTHYNNQTINAQLTQFYASLPRQ
jgi:glycosyltransferase involved in cell wall biosynthesis